MICFAPSSAIYAAPNGSRADAAVAQKCRSKWSAHYPSQTVRPPQRDDRFGSADLAFGCYSGPKTISLGRLALLARLGFQSAPEIPYRGMKPSKVSAAFGEFSCGVGPIWPQVGPLATTGSA